MVWIGALYPSRDRQHDGVVTGIRPCLKIIAVHPDNIGNIVIAIAKVSTKRHRFLSTIRLEGGEPAAGLDRIQQDRDPMRCCNSKHIVDSLEVHGVGS